MYKVVLSHIIIPGKYDDLAEWCREADKKRKQENPAYVPPSRFINQYGDSFKVQIEFEHSEMPSEPMNYGKSNQNSSNLSYPVQPEWRFINPSINVSYS